MRWLGMTAAIVTLIAVVLNSIWFVRRGLGFGGFLSMVWPVALATLAVLAFAIGLGLVSVRAMLHAAAEAEEAGEGVHGAPGQDASVGGENPAGETPKNQVDTGRPRVGEETGG